MSSTEVVNEASTLPPSKSGFWRWVTDHADGLKAVAAIAVTPLIIIIGWRIAASAADRADTAETARVDAEIAADRQLTQSTEQFKAEQQRLQHEFEESLDERRADRADEDRNAQYVALAISILDEPVRDGDQLQDALRRYAVDILLETSPITIPAEIAQAFVEGRLTVPTALFDPNTFDLIPERAFDFDFELERSIEELAEQRACSPTDRVGCLFDGLSRADG